jgi:hypothetical protein
MSGSTYQGNGWLVKDDLSAIQPDEQFMIGENGSVFSFPKIKKEMRLLLLKVTIIKQD